MNYNKNINKILTLGLLLLGSTCLIAPDSAFATQAVSATPAPALPAPDGTALQQPPSGDTTLIQPDPSQGTTAATPLPSTTATPSSTATKGDNAAITAIKSAVKKPTATDAQPVVTAPTKPAKDESATLPAASAVLEKLGLKKGAPDTPASQTAQEVPAIQAPPGLDLPVDQDLDAEQSEARKQVEMRKKAFDASTQSLMPMKTDEIRKLLELYDQTQQAVQTPIYPDPKPESTFQTISLEPGAQPVILKTAVGHVTTLSIVDASGQPWPIQDISWAGNFEVLQPEPGSNMLRITPMADFAFGNVSMRLIGLNPPVIFTLRTERKSVQVRADVQIPQLGPNGIAPPIEGQVTTTAGDSKLSTILEGVAPPSSTRLKIAGIDGRTTAYDVGGQTYVRTPYTLLSPAWDSSVRSADGMNVYAMKFTPVLLLSDKGKMVRAQLSKVDTSDE